MNKKFLSVVLAAVMLTAFSACGKEKNNETESNVIDTDTTVSSAASEVSSKAAATPDTPDKPKKVLTPYDYPYNTEKLKADLISYGEELGLYYDDSVTMKNATSISNNQTKAAANGTALEKWCKNDLDGIEKLAKYQNIDIDEVSFNIIIYDSPNYDGEYIIGIYAQTE